MPDAVLLVVLVALTAGLLWRLDWLDRVPSLWDVAWNAGVYLVLIGEFAEVTRRAVDSLPIWQAAVLVLLLWPAMAGGGVVLLYVAFRSWYNRLPP